MQAPRGTYDLYGIEMEVHNYVVQTIIDIAKSYDYRQIKTPIFEDSGLFRRSVGESSDVVQKEMYEFSDKGGRNITLRPEITAAVIRAFLSNKIYGERKNQYKFFYYGEVFRYERPQKGRFRQFYQFGVEFLGETSFYSDLEVILMANNILKNLNIDQNITLKVNSIGKSSERKKYSNILKKYFKDYQKDLCSDCNTRIENNPLRILDCKVDGEKDFVKNAPLLRDYISNESTNNFQNILKTLDEMNINYEIDPMMVRGLDYYNDLVFEFIHDESNITVIGGGRYDTLVQELGGNEMPAVGFALGIERMIDIFLQENKGIEKEIDQTIDVFYTDLSEKNLKVMLESMKILRENGIICRANYKKVSLKSAFSQAEKAGAVYIVVLDDKYKEDKMVRIKNLETKEEVKIELKKFEEDIIKE